MLYFYINNTERAEDVEIGISHTSQLRERTDSLSATVFQGTKPQENQDVKLYLGDTIQSFATKTVTLYGKYQTGTNFFYPGQKLHIRIGDADEEIVEVDTYDEANHQIVLVEAPSGTVSQGDKIGELKFAGSISRVEDKNTGHITQLEWDITCVDYQKQFDKKRITDSWEDVTAQYLINSFVNSEVNYNRTLDTLDYDDNTAIQTAWVKGADDANNATVNSSVYIEGDASGSFGWTNATNTATWTKTLTTVDLSELLGVSTGTPTKGDLMLWINAVDITTITAIKIRIGSDASNYAEFTFDTPAENDKWTYTISKATQATVTGTPVWTATDYAQIRITQTGNSSIKLNGLRLNANGSFTLYQVDDQITGISEFRSPRIPPSQIMQSLADAYSYIWYIDYEKDIVFRGSEDVSAPFVLDDTSNNFDDLKIEVDQSQLGNRVVVYGGEKVSTSEYRQVFEGNGIAKEWLLKNKFKNLVITIDNNTSTDTTEAGTNTTTINATGHGLSVGDHIVNRTRSNAVREVLTVPSPDQFTVEAVTGQTTGDTFSKFDTAVTSGIEGIADETTVDYVFNSNEKSVRATAGTATLFSGTFIRFEYLERVPLQIEYTDTSSVTALKALGIGDGIFDLDPIRDQNITDTATAITLAQAKVADYSNAIINGSFKTDRNGLRSGQVINITDTTRGIATAYLIQKVRGKLTGGRYKDYIEYTVTFGTTLFGVIEFYQKLLKQGAGLGFNEDANIAKIITAYEDVEFAETNSLSPTHLADEDETVESDDSNNLYSVTSWNWEVSTGQPIETRWDLFHWG